MNARNSMEMNNMDFIVCRYVKKDGSRVELMHFDNLPDAENAVRRFQFDDLAKFGQSSRYRIYNEMGDLVCGYYKLRLGQRDRDLERRVALGIDGKN